MRLVRLVPITLSLLVAGLLINTGCEDNSSLSGDEFSISPSSKTMASDDESVVLEAVGGSEPMTWSVADDSLGTVSGSGRSVVYTRTSSSGINLVTVEDSQTWTAMATITQTDATDEEDLSISPTSITLSHDGDNTVFTASGGTSPYEWDVGNSGRGRVTVPEDTSTATYTRDGTGDNTVIVKDSEGTVAIATVSQPQDASLSLSATATTLSSDGAKSILTASGGTSPYTWSMSDDSLGGLSATTGNSVTYTRNHSGTQVITVVDDEGYTRSIIISQP
jgi:hypothetical protein